jgi:glycosyltransferase involved in cell wall biosynthesis
MRIALVATGGFDRSGRTRVIPALLWLVERLARTNDVVVYVLRYHDTPCRYALLGATVCDLGRPRGMVAQYRALANAVREDGPFDVIHGYWAVPAGLLAALLGRRFGIPSVVTCDSGEFVSIGAVDYGQQRGLRTRLAVTAALRLATTVTVCSKFQAKLARPHGVVPEVVPLGVDTRLFNAPLVVLDDGPPFRLLHVASLNPVKDQATLLRAVHELLRRRVDVTLDIVGEDTLSGALEPLVATLGLVDRVTFHGFRASDELAAFYHAAHLFVLPSLHEAAGVVLLEAAACALPVVGSNVGYLADWSPAAATSVAPANPGALADAIESLLGNRSRRARASAEALAFARSFDADWTARTFETIYKELASARTPGS